MTVCEHRWSAWEICHEFENRADGWYDVFWYSRSCYKCGAIEVTPKQSVYMGKSK